MLAMPCNTAHHWYTELARDLAVPFPHIADAVAAELPQAPARVAIIATAATLASRIYAGRLDAGYGWIMPSNDEYARAVQPCIDAVKRNRCVEAGHLRRTRRRGAAAARRTARGAGLHRAAAGPGRDRLCRCAKPASTRPPRWRARARGWWVDSVRLKA